MANRVLTALKADVKGFWRNKSNVFWTIAFPLLLILLFGAIFAGSGTVNVPIAVQDQSDSVASHAFLDALNQTHSVSLTYIDKSANLDKYIQDNSPSVVLVIPANFTNAFVPGATNGTATLQIRTDPTVQSSGIALGLINGIAQQFNLQIAQGGNKIVMTQADIVQKHFKFIDFFLPGVIALTSMTTTIFWMVSVMTRYRTNGIFKKLMTTPITRYEWLASQILWQLVVVFISVGVIVLVGVAIFGMTIVFSPIAIVTIVLSSALFSSMGMIIARFIRDEETASSAANAITFPMMFLSGIFFELSSMPDWLQGIAHVLPLTYVGDALRDSMVYGNDAAALGYMAVVAVLAVIFFVAGVLVSKWKTE